MTVEHRTGHGDVGRAYDAHARDWLDRRRASPDRLIVLNRCRELRTWLGYRYGDTIPDDDAGREDLALLLNYVMQANPGKAVPAMMAEAATWAPWMTHVARRALSQRIAARPPIKFKADTLAERIGCTYAERVLLGFTTIGCCDLTRAARDKATRRRRTGAQTARRRAAGVAPRSVYHKKSEAMRAAAAALGITYEAMRKRVRRAAKAACPKSVATVKICLSLATHFGHRAIRTAQAIRDEAWDVGQSTTCADQVPGWLGASP